MITEAELERIEADAEKVSEEFEGDCWKAIRSILAKLHFDWRDAEPDGISADEAHEYISDTLDEMERDESRLRARAEAAEAEVERLRKALEPFAKIEPSTAVAEDGSEDEPYRVFLACKDRFDFTGSDLARARAALGGQND